MVTLDLLTTLGFVASVVLPALVALVTKQSAHPGLKAIVLLVLASVTGYVTTWIDALNHAAAFSPGAAVVPAVMSFAVAVLVHVGLLSPVGLTGSQGAIQTKTSGFGLG